MVCPVILLRITQDRPPDVSKRAWDACCKKAWLDVGQYWHEHYMPEHFTRAARTKYNYAPRKEKYQKKKEMASRRGGRKNRDAVLMGGQVDLVYTGLLKRLVERSITIKAFPTRATLILHGPRYVVMRAREGNVNKTRELFALTTTEQVSLSQMLADKTVEYLEKIKRPKTKTP